ncbi:unnamed protein product [Zymoseptoria tritici ST99CH_3D7]|uniref:Uncharacterized protein n=1 Tax=Zymoseptoria tritici (strain ST99CH_3D7) TaxID=1276538 RepID=A0A1X7S8T3_ZYMT9|nr:unnamed protein product [Zymoseptoria tritici ST99CH_3D7]
MEQPTITPEQTKAYISRIEPLLKTLGLETPSFDTGDVNDTFFSLGGAANRAVSDSHWAVSDRRAAVDFLRGDLIKIRGGHKDFFDPTTASEAVLDQITDIQTKMDGRMAEFKAARATEIARQEAKQELEAVLKEWQAVVAGKDPDAGRKRQEEAEAKMSEKARGRLATERRLDEQTRRREEARKREFEDDWVTWKSGY